MVVDLLATYSAQSAQYLELMTSFSWMSERAALVKAIADKPDFQGKLDALDAAGLANLVEVKKQALAKSVLEIEKKRGCDTDKGKPACQVSYRFIAQISRNSTADDVFVQTAIAAALVRSEPMVVAFNYVQAEDAAVPRADYSEHMRIAAYLASNPRGAKRVNITLHAGELWLGLVPPGDLTFHIYEAVTVAGAQRIGHGVDLAFENKLDDLLQTMRQKKIAVEINLTSNDQILGVRGNRHPFPAYRAAGVPVVLSTDDAAVERIDLTNEYVRAARDYGLDYAALKAIARASLTYSFLDKADKQNELKRFDAASAAFEHAMATRASLLADLSLVVKAEFGRR
jgi:adenosine deaminase